MRRRCSTEFVAQRSKRSPPRQRKTARSGDAARCFASPSGKRGSPQLAPPATAGATRQSELAAPTRTPNAAEQPGYLLSVRACAKCEQRGAARCVAAFAKRL